jgi:hypothetical protein
MWRALAETGRALGRGLVELLYPPGCVVCGATSDSRAAGPANHFCVSCLSRLTSNPRECCPRCAADVGPFALVEGAVAAAATNRFRSLGPCGWDPTMDCSARWCCG